MTEGIHPDDEECEYDPADDYDGPDAPDPADRDLAVEWGGLDIPS